MKYIPCEGALPRIADSFADLLAMYPKTQVQITHQVHSAGLAGPSSDGYRIDGGGNDFGSSRMVWPVGSCVFAVKAPEGHGWLRLRIGNELAVEEFVSRFPPTKYSLYGSASFLGSSDGTELIVAPLGDFPVNRESFALDGGVTVTFCRTAHQ